MNIAPYLILMHALGFAAAAVFLVTLIRRSAEAAWRKALPTLLKTGRKI